MMFHKVANRILDENPKLIGIALGKEVQQATAAQPVILASKWGPNGARYVNKERGIRYKPHHEEEREFIHNDKPRRWLLKGGEGSGKSTAGVIKDLERLRRGMSGIMGSPNFVHFRKSLWPEFRRWCPRNAVIPVQRYRLEVEWQPNQPFELVFEDMGYGRGTLLCGGFDSPGSWEGPNVNFAHIDEGRHLATPAMAKVLDGRCRIPGSNGEAPQWWITTTPRKSKVSQSPDDAQFHWLFEMFGPWQGEDDAKDNDPFYAFKQDARVTTLRLRDNSSNLAEGFVEQRVQSLTHTEERILADAEWEDEEDVERFLPNMALWDSCQVAIPPLDPRTPLVVALDAATGRQSTVSDCFGLVAVSPRIGGGQGGAAIRYVQKWQAKKGEQIHYRTPLDDGPGDVLRWLIENYNVVCVTFDPHQLVFVAQEMEQEGLVWVQPFNQSSDRLVADRNLYDTIIQKVFEWGPEVSGIEELRNHIDNADRKVDADKYNFRLIQGRGKIDLAVSASMAVKQLSELNL